MDESGRSPSPLYTLASHAPEPVRGPLQRAAARAASINVAWPVLVVVALAALGLVLGTKLGGIDAATAEALGAECLVVVLFVIALWDLLVRWGQITELPLLTGPGPQVLGRRLLRHVGPPLFLAVGIVLGHWFWT
ncbi:MAG TPA: hypothetical protein VE953_05140 [Terriglobales bacterium]|nr:hypothetical protein [Terriglobales bacterium]